MAATKSASFDSTVSRRSVLALLGGLAVAGPLTPETAESGARRNDLVIRDGWILRRDDLTRFG